MRQSSRVFKENLAIICDELHLAKQWGKASIILTTHHSAHSQIKLRRALKNGLIDIGYDVVEISVNDIDGNFIDDILSYENVDNIVFFISNIGWGGGEDDRDGYRAINLYRETLVEQKIKVVFILTSEEATNLPNYAPDFWAFRHRVFGFVSPRGKKNTDYPVGLMRWHLENVPFADDLKSKIHSLETTLSEFPEQDETVAWRIDLLYELGFLYWHAGAVSDAEKVLREGIKLAKLYKLADLLAKCQNGLSILFYEAGELSAALELIKLAYDENPQDCIPNLNQAVILFTMGKRYLAIQKAKKATELCSQNPWGWNTLGFLYFFAGRMDEAIASLKSSLDISPSNDYFSQALALCYLELGLHEQAQFQLDQTQVDSRSIISKLIEVYIQNNKEKASAYLAKIVSAGKLSKLEISRNPILNIISNPKDAA